MATSLSPSSPSAHDDDIPTATLALPSASSGSRRLPPPCWSPDETVALIEAYRDKWYSLRRSNLKANHWQEVADDVAARCPASPPKTAVQCRHKMEKLRKRYRSEIQRSAGAARRSASPWAHFQNMHSMEKGTDNPTPPSSPSSSSEEEDTKTNSVKRINDLYNRHTNQNGYFPNHPDNPHNGATPGVRIKLPGAAAKTYGQNSNPNPNPRSIPPNWKRGAAASVETDVVGEVVEAIQAMGEGFILPF